jgi:DNA-directed RNA polymerase subunit RPC12/RpoP
MEYTRLTEKDWHKEKFYPTTDNERAIRKRLWNLENQIEQGTLIEKKTCVYKQAKELDFVWWECSDCGSGFNFYANTPYQNRFHYCPYCGAKIIECKEKDNG